MDRNLAIGIPTYNRSSVLRDGLEHLIPIVRPYKIPIYVSDNASDDDTEDVVLHAQLKYRYIFLHKNSKNVGMDGNFKQTLGLPDSRYVWLLGDDDRIQTDIFDAVYEIIKNSSYDIVVLNGGSKEVDRGRVRGLDSRHYSDREDILKDIGWHMTWISGLVISSRLIKRMEFSNYIGSLFSHFGSIFTAFGNYQVINAYWFKKSCFYPSEKAVFSWSNRVLEVFAKKWTAVVLSLPENKYSEESKNKCILDHSLHTGIFSIMGLVKLRSEGAISTVEIKKYADSLGISSQTNSVLIRIIASIPVWPLMLARRLWYAAMRGKYE